MRYPLGTCYRCGKFGLTVFVWVLHRRYCLTCLTVVMGR